MEIPFSGTYDRRMMLKAIQLINQPSRLAAVIRIGIAVLAIVLFVLWVISFIDKPEHSVREWYRLARSIFVVGFFSYLALQPYLYAYWVAHRTWKDEDMRKPLRGFINASGISLIDRQGNVGEIRWDKFIKRRVSAEMISCMTGNGVIFALPRSFFGSDADWKRAASLVDYKLAQTL